MENSNFNPIPSEEYSGSRSMYDRITNSVIVKMIVIFVLTLMMLIPMSWVSDLIVERKNRESQVASDISLKWGQSQVISTAVLAIPIKYVDETTQKDDKGKEFVVRKTVEDWLFVLPDNADLSVDVQPQYLKRGIFQSVVYNSKVDMQGTFSKPNLKSLNLAEDALNWSQAKLVMGIQDVKGLSIPPKVNFANQNYSMKMSATLFTLFPNNLVADLQIEKTDNNTIPFSLSYELKGSKSFNYLPLANQTKLDIKGTWNNPSFNGGYLPDNREVGDTTFTARWNIPSFGRKLPQQWIGERQIYQFADLMLTEDINMYTPEAATSNSPSSVSTDVDMVQVNFLPEVNNYQKTSRVSKYGLLVIVLTFASLFFTETIKKQRIHIVQYILIGFAMVLFYSLLLAISEHFGFNIAYLIAAVATILLIGSFIQMITKNRNTALLFAGILSLFYSFIYILMQLRDYSLIAGTVGVFIILAVLMRISTKINWYQFDNK